MKEKLIESAKEKGFKSLIIGKSVNAKYTKKDFYYLWMCEVQKWLRDLHNIDIEIGRTGEVKEPKTGYTWNIYSDIKFNYADNIFNTYGQALEHGLIEGLNFIIKN